MKATQTTGTEHDLKVWPGQFEALQDGRKTFEIRRDDRGGFEAGDVLLLREWQPGAANPYPDGTLPGDYTGRQVRRLVTYVLEGDTAEAFGAQPGFAVMSLAEATRPCLRCEGTGQIANTDDGEPWSVWEQLPPGSDLAVRAGLVRPITCPGCRGEKVVPL